MKAANSRIAGTLISLPLGLSLVLAGCGRGPAGGPGSDGDKRQPAGIASAADQGEFATTGDDLSSSNSGTASADIPFGIAQYPGARPLGASPSHRSSGGRDVTLYQYEISDPPAQVIAFYKGEAIKAGFVAKNGKNRKRTGLHSLSAVRPDGGIMNVDIQEQAGGTIVVSLRISDHD